MPIFFIPDICFVQDPHVGDALWLVQVLDFDICDRYLIIWFLDRKDIWYLSKDIW